MEIFLQNGFQPFGIPRLACQAAREKKFRGVGYRIALAQSVHPNPKQRSQVDGKALICRTVQINHLLIRRPGPIKKRNQPVMKQIKKMP